jgi:hypothetical protein
MGFLHAIKTAHNFDTTLRVTGRARMWIPPCIWVRVHRLHNYDEFRSWRPFAFEKGGGGVIPSPSIAVDLSQRDAAVSGGGRAKSSQQPESPA